MVNYKKSQISKDKLQINSKIQNSNSKPQMFNTCTFFIWVFGFDGWDLFVF